MIQFSQYEDTERARRYDPGPSNTVESEGKGLYTQQLSQRRGGIRQRTTARGNNASVSKGERRKMSDRGGSRHSRKRAPSKTPPFLSRRLVSISYPEAPAGDAFERELTRICKAPQRLLARPCLLCIFVCFARLFRCSSESPAPSFP